MHLHQNPELSNCESETRLFIKEMLSYFNPDRIMDLASEKSLAFIFNDNPELPTVVFRAELDALPIHESNTFDHCSINEGVAHSCGHDGHMTILLGLVSELDSSPVSGLRVVLLFQSAEETGEGALDVVNDKQFAALNPEYIFAFHNIPGKPRNQIIIKEEGFTSASKGIIIQLKGKTSHAAYPEDGINPDLAIADIIQEFNSYSNSSVHSIITVVHVLLGEIAFGTAAGYAEIRATLRSDGNDSMSELTQQIEFLVYELARKYKLESEIHYSEEFFAVSNNKSAALIVETAARQLELDIEILQEPYKWSEDFSHYSKKYKSALIGIGSGVTQPQLHNSNYDFPDEITETGIKVFHHILKIIEKN